MKRSTTDPRRLRGSIVGPGGPHDEAGVLLDTSRAVLLHGVDVCSVDGTGLLAMLLSGRINKTRDHVHVLYLMDEDGLAAILTEIVALLGRAGDPRAAELRRLIEARFADLDRAGHASQADAS